MMNRLLRKVAIAGAAALAFCATAAHAELFNYSYTFGGGAVINGSFTGTANGAYVDNIANVSAFYNGNPYAGSPDLFHTAWNTTTHTWDNTIPAVVSTNARLNNFLFIDTDYPSSWAYTNFFFMVNDSVYYDIHQAFGAQPSFYVSDNSIDASRWSLTVANPVPEPETYALLLAGLGLLGFAAHRRKLKGNAGAFQT